MLMIGADRCGRGVAAHRLRERRQSAHSRAALTGRANCRCGAPLAHLAAPSSGCCWPRARGSPAAAGLAGALALAYWAVAVIATARAGRPAGAVAQSRSTAGRWSSRSSPAPFAWCWPDSVRRWAAHAHHSRPRSGQASSRTTAGRVRVRQVIVGLQVALAVVLLVGGGLMVTTLARLMSVDLGYQADSALTMRVQLPRGKTYPPDGRSSSSERALAAARARAGRFHRRRE